MRMQQGAVRRVRVVVGVLLLAGTAAMICPAARAVAAGRADWRSGPAIGSMIRGSLGSVAVTSGRNAWAVGSTELDLSTLIEHWNGTAWHRVPSPNPNIMPYGALTGVAASSATSVWAVGYHYNGAYRTLILRWTGTAWIPVASPNPGGPARHNFLYGVAATSAASAWSVGQYYNGRAYQALILHWNGTAWTQMANPDLDGSLNAVAATSAANAWAVGQSCATNACPEVRQLIEHWNGTAWQRVPGPASGHSGSLTGVTATSARNVWAVGASTNIAGSPVIEHWNGSTWRQVPCPAFAGETLQAVSATSARNAWAVGHINTGVLILHWNGTKWRRAPGPHLARLDSLSGVAATSASNAWAVGTSAIIGASPVIEHWNGSTWRRVPSS